MGRRGGEERCVGEVGRRGGGREVARGGGEERWRGEGAPLDGDV